MVPCRPALADLHAIMGSRRLSAVLRGRLVLLESTLAPKTQGTLVDRSSAAALTDQGDAEVAPVTSSASVYAHVRAFAAGADGRGVSSLPGRRLQEIATLYD